MALRLPGSKEMMDQMSRIALLGVGVVYFTAPRLHSFIGLAFSSVIFFVFVQDDITALVQDRLTSYDFFFVVRCPDMGVNG